MQTQPLINILTRTSGRPRAFKRCRRSVINQTYKNIRHLISIDNIGDRTYVEKYTNDYFFVDKIKLNKEKDIKRPGKLERFVANLYVNELIKHVKEGWVMIMDDDDYLVHNQTVEKIRSAIKSDSDMIIWQFKFKNRKTIYPIEWLTVPKKVGTISSQCVLVHSNIAKQVKWDGWKAGDFRFIRKIWNKTKKKRWIKEILVMADSMGLGRKMDLGKSIHLL